MNRWDKVKLMLTRNWNLPGKKRLASRLIPAVSHQQQFYQGISWLENENIAIYVDSRSYIEWQVLSNGTFEPEMARLYGICALPGETALDIGANIGIQSLRLSRLVGEQGKVIACEPMPHLRRRLEANLLLNKVFNVTVVPQAISDFNGKIDIHVDTQTWNQGTGSLANTEKPNTTIEVIKGDTLLENLTVTRLDFVKIDVEGYEFPVLKGLEKHLRRYHPRIIFEYDANYWIRSQSTFSECYQYLQSLEYDLYEIFEFGMRPLSADSAKISSNIFCLPQSKHEQ